MFDASETNIRFIYLAYGLFCLYLVFALRTVHIHNETIFLIGYLCFGVLSILWSEDPSTSLLRVRGVFLLLIFLVLTTTYADRTAKPIGFLYAVVVGSLALSLYMFAVYDASYVLEALLQAGMRIGSRINNVNAVANSLAVGMVALVGIVVFYRKRLLLLLMIPLGVCLLAAGSRMATLSFLAGMLVIIYLMMRSRNVSQAALRMLAVLFVIAAVWLVIRNIPATRELILRFENSFAIITGGETVYKENSTQTRLDYIELGWKAFLESPLWGNGIGCAGYALQEEYGYVTYLHNNYVEILASGGIIGFVLYYTPYFMVFKKLGRRIFHQNDHDPVLCIAFSLLIMKLAGHWGTVMYYSKIEYILLALWISVVNIGRIENGR